MHGFRFGVPEITIDLESLGLLSAKMPILQASQVGQELAQELGNIADLMMQRPVITLVALVILAVVIALVSLKIIRYLESPSDRFLDSISKADNITILMHKNPDPDAMASAMGVQRLAQEVDTEAQIAYPGRISHHENRAFRAVLDVSFENINHVEEISGDKVVLVDHHEPRGLIGGETLVADAVIDHHPLDGSEDSDSVEFWHVDESFGSCAAIVCEFLSQQNLITKGSGKSDRISEKVSTALYQGIRSDTDDLSRSVSSNDFKAITLLYSSVNEDMLYRIANPKVDGDSLETKARAIMGRQVRGSFAVSDVGGVQNTDAIPQAADELVKLEGISATVIFGICEGSIRISGRAYDDRVHMGRTLQRAVEDIPESSAGGHTGMAGGSIPQKVLESEEMTRKDLIERIFDALGGE